MYIIVEFNMLCRGVTISPLNQSKRALKFGHQNQKQDHPPSIFFLSTLPTKEKKTTASLPVACSCASDTLHSSKTITVTNCICHCICLLQVNQRVSLTSFVFSHMCFFNYYLKTNSWLKLIHG